MLYSFMLLELMDHKYLKIHLVFLLFLLLCPGVSPRLNTLFKLEIQCKLRWDRAGSDKEIKDCRASMIN